MIPLRFLVAVPLFIGCKTDDIVGPPRATGHWRLTSVNGVLGAKAGGYGQFRLASVIDSAEVIFRRYGRAQDIRHGYRTTSGGPIYFSDTTIVTYALRGDLIFVTRLTPTESDIYVDSGTIGETPMEIVVRTGPSRETGVMGFSSWGYTRIGDTPP